MPKNFDPNLDYDSLLTAFKAKVSLTKKALKEAQFNGEKYGKIQAEHEAWIEKNITSRGLSYEFNQFTGEPMCLYVVLAGKEL